ncbi:MAG TPA: protein kinase [Anaerolineales bacterium]|jgi:serine/threonine-protein kinase
MAEPALLNNRYQLLEPLGTGGMAQVYRARDLMLERFVAIKMLRADYSADPVVQVRFRQEAKSAANLSHPNIVTVHDFGFDQGKLFIVMEHVPGTNLKIMIDNLGKFSPEDALPILVQACAGLGYAHRSGIVHCDVKPHNILITPDHRVKVTDFGIARAISGIHPDEQSDVVWGSPLYFSPEQAAGLAPSPASDVYSLGVVMYEMLAGRPPFVAKTADTLARLHREVKPQPPIIFNPRIQPELEQIILKVLSKEPSARYRTADQLGRVLMTFGQHKSTPRPAAAPPPAQPGIPTLAAKPTSSQPVPVYLDPEPQPEEDAIEIDWLSVGLGLLALAAVGGLVPLWLAIFFRWNNVLP